MTPYLIVNVGGGRVGEGKPWLGVAVVGVNVWIGEEGFREEGEGMGDGRGWSQAQLEVVLIWLGLYIDFGYHGYSAPIA